MRRSIAILVAASLAIGCRADTSPSVSKGRSTSGSPRAAAEPDSRPSAGCITAALAAARAVELPEPDARPDFSRLEAVHAATGGKGFVETLEASVRDTSGNAYDLQIRIAHRADPLSYRATLSRRTEGERFAIGNIVDVMRERLPGGDTAMLAQIRETMPFSLRPEREIIRVGESYWRREPGGWSGPHRRSPGDDLPEPTPLVALSDAVEQAVPPARRPDPVGEEIVHGRRTTHYRIEDRFVLRTLWNGLAIELFPSIRAVDSPGVVDLWVQEGGLVLRALLRLKTAAGDEYSATMEARDFGTVPHIGPPR